MKIDRKMLGKRILYRLYGFIREGVVKEISPNGEYVKIKNKYYEEWYHVSDIWVLDILD